MINGICKFDETWEEISKNRVFGKYPPEHLIRFMSRNYYRLDRASIKVLDIGCGGGGNAWYLAREGFDVYAFDGSKSAVENTRAYLAANGVTANLAVMPAIDMNYENDFFDCIIDWGTLVVSGSKDMINEIYHKIYCCLKVGGRLISTGYTMECTGAGTGIELEKNTFSGELYGPMAGYKQVHYTSENEIKDMLDDCGFREIAFDKIRYTNQSANGATTDMFVSYAVK